MQLCSTAVFLDEKFDGMPLIAQGSTPPAEGGDGRDELCCLHRGGGLMMGAVAMAAVAAALVGSGGSGGHGRGGSCGENGGSGKWQ